MKKNISFKCQWHIIVLSICILCFSMLCWRGFVKDISSINDLKTSMDKKWYDNIFKKSYFSNLDSVFTFCVTGEVKSNQVLLGSKNWLFYKSPTDGNSIGDYEGTNRYSEEKMDNILKAVLSTQNEIEARGIKFAILVAPNKENIYSEYMPDNYIHEEISSTDILVEYLKKNGVNISSPKQEMLDIHLDKQLYYQYDTHWNQLGAYIGVKSVLSLWDINLISLSERTISSKKLKGNYHLCGEDDLAKMAGLRSIFDDELEYEIDGTILMDWSDFKKAQKNEEVRHYTNDKSQIKATVLLVGDSFRASMLPALREIYSDVYVVYRSWYKSELLDEIKPDYLIAEYVERFSAGIGSIGSLISK